MKQSEIRQFGEMEVKTGARRNEWVNPATSIDPMSKVLAAKQLRMCCRKQMNKRQDDEMMK